MNDRYYTNAEDHALNSHYDIAPVLSQASHFIYTVYFSAGHVS